MNRTSWSYGILCLIFIFQGCAEEGTDVGEIISDSPDATVVYPGTPDGGGLGFPSFPDVSSEGGGDDVDGGSVEGDTVDPADTESSDEDTEEEGGESTEGGDVDTPEIDVTEPEDDTEEETDTSSGGEAPLTPQEYAPEANLDNMLSWHFI